MNTRTGTKKNKEVENQKGREGLKILKKGKTKKNDNKPNQIDKLPILQN